MSLWCKTKRKDPLLKVGDIIQDSVGLNPDIEPFRVGFEQLLAFKLVLDVLARQQAHIAMRPEVLAVDSIRSQYVSHACDFPV
jgi:hypothetical protein